MSYYAFSDGGRALSPGFDNMVRTLSPRSRNERANLTRSLSLFVSKKSQFFGLFGLSNRASSMIGPNVIQGVINHTGNNWDGFPFLFALCTSASLVIWFAVDVQKGRRAAVRWAAQLRRTVIRSQAPRTRSGWTETPLVVQASPSQQTFRR